MPAHKTDCLRCRQSYLSWRICGRQLWQLSAGTGVSGAFFEVELAACKTLAVMELIIRLGKRPIKHNLDGFRASCAGVGSSHPGLDSIDRNPKLVPLPALPTIGGSLLPGTCDDEYSTCWPPACQLQRTALPLLPGSPPHSSGGASGSARASPSACCLAGLGRRDG